jgi:hypothetical protein
MSFFGVCKSDGYAFSNTCDRKENENSRTLKKEKTKCIKVQISGCEVQILISQMNMPGTGS